MIPAIALLVLSSLIKKCAKVISDASDKKSWGWDVNPEGNLLQNSYALRGQFFKGA